MKLTAQFYVTTPNIVWNGTNNGVYSVAIEPNIVSDTNGNFMPAGVIGSFTVATETKPVVGMNAPFNSVMNVATNFTLTAQSSFPYLPDDIFNFTIDWNNDGSVGLFVSTAYGYSCWFARSFLEHGYAKAELVGRTQ